MSTQEPAAHPALAHLPIFAKLDAEGLADLEARLTRRRVPAGEPVFWFGDDGDTLYVIESGRVEVTAPAADGQHVLLDTLQAGGIFGELSLFDGGPRSATVRAVTECSLIELRRDAFHAFLRARPGVAIDVLQVLGARQRASTVALRGLKNPNAVIAEGTTRWQRVSDVVASVAASHTFTIAHLCWFGSWILTNIVASAGWLPARLAFDPFPFGLLTLIVSLEAIFLSIFVLVSQNRQSERDRIRTDLDHQVNVKAHVEIVGVVERLERIERGLERLARTGGTDPAR
ncbi:MAG: cyclic nucleotide-binding domain-containing protein [Vicinamibacterales bacterium]